MCFLSWAKYIYCSRPMCFIQASATRDSTICITSPYVFLGIYLHLRCFVGSTHSHLTSAGRTEFHQPISCFRDGGIFQHQHFVDMLPVALISRIYVFSIVEKYILFACAVLHHWATVAQWLPRLAEKSEKSEEPMDENFEMEIGITCGEEDGVDQLRR
jgi:hypothetical protein